MRRRRRRQRASRTVTAEAPSAETEKPAQPAKRAGPPNGEANSFQDLLAASSAAKAEPAPGPRPLPPEAAPEQAGRAPQQDWAPPMDMRPPQGAPRQLQAPAGRAPPRVARPDEAARQPQPPQRGARPGPAPGAPNLANRPPSRAEHGGRPAGVNGSMPGGQMVAVPAGGPAHAPRPGPPRGAQGDRGPLVESVPRRMRVGVTSKAEVRIARDRIEALVVALNSHSMPHRPDKIAARALSVRLKAPNGSFLIEAVSPETQWVEGVRIRTRRVRDLALDRDPAAQRPRPPAADGFGPYRRAGRAGRGGGAARACDRCTGDAQPHARAGTLDSLAGGAGDRRDDSASSATNSGRPPRCCSTRCWPVSCPP